MADSAQAGIAPAAVALQQAGADLVPSTPEVLRAEVLRAQTAATATALSLVQLDVFVPALEAIVMMVPVTFLRAFRGLASCLVRAFADLTDPEKACL